MTFDKRAIQYDNWHDQELTNGTRNIPCKEKILTVWSEAYMYRFRIISSVKDDLYHLFEFKTKYLASIIYLRNASCLMISLFAVVYLDR